jgi:hypothetical protein
MLSCRQLPLKHVPLVPNLVSAGINTWRKYPLGQGPEPVTPNKLDRTTRERHELPNVLNNREFKSGAHDLNFDPLPFLISGKGKGKAGCCKFPGPSHLPLPVEIPKFPPRESRHSEIWLASWIKALLTQESSGYCEPFAERFIPIICRPPLC